MTKPMNIVVRDASAPLKEWEVEIENDLDALEGEEASARFAEAKVLGDEYQALAKKTWDVEGPERDRAWAEMVRILIRAEALHCVGLLWRANARVLPPPFPRGMGGERGGSGGHPGHRAPVPGEGLEHSPPPGKPLPPGAAVVAEAGLEHPSRQGARPCRDVGHRGRGEGLHPQGRLRLEVQQPRRYRDLARWPALIRA